MQRTTNNIAGFQLSQEIEIIFNNIVEAAKKNDLTAMIDLFANRDNDSVWKLISTRDDMRKHLIAAALENQALQVLSYFMIAGIFTHADYEDYVNVNNKMNCNATLMLAMNSEAPVEVGNLIVDHIRVVESNSYTFSTLLFIRYVNHLIEIGDGAHIKQVLDDSRVCLTIGEQYGFVHACQTSCFSSIKNKMERLKSLNITTILGSMKFIHQMCSLKQISEIFWSDERTYPTEQQKQEAQKVVDMYIINGVIQGLNCLLVEFVDEIINSAAKQSTSTTQFSYHNNTEAMLAYKNLLNNIAAHLPNTGHITHTISYLFNSLIAACLNQQENGDLQDKIQAKLNKFVAQGICKLDNTKKPPYVLSEAFNNFKKIVDQQQQLNQTLDKEQLNIRGHSSGGFGCSLL